MKLLDTNERLKMLLNTTSDKLELIDKILLNKFQEQSKTENKNQNSYGAKTCTQREAAIRLGVSYSTIHRMMKNGRLKSIIVNKNPRILLSSVMEFALSA